MRGNKKKTLTVGECSITGDGERERVIYLLPLPVPIFHSDWKPSANDEGGNCEGAEALQVHGKVNTIQSL